MKKLMLWYKDESPFGNEDRSDFADRPDDGWEKWSLPIGNGYFGANIFGRKDTERVQITENSLCNPYARGQGGLNNFAEILIHFSHGGCRDFRRFLDLNRAVAGVEYTYNGVEYRRSYFTSYPDRVLVMKFESQVKKSLSFEIEMQIPYVKPYLYEENDGMGKSGAVSSNFDTITLSGEMEYYKILFEGQLKIMMDGGIMKSSGGVISIRNATSAVIIVALGTNYRMESRVFTEPEPGRKLECRPNPHKEIAKTLALAGEKGYDSLLKDHIEDYQALFNRVDFSISGEECELPTDVMLEEYKNGVRHPYLEELYFQYGRYLLISSSRPGTYPANLQGTWNKYDHSPWSGGYWHNINVQMNYWPAFNTNLAELFEPYTAYYRAYLPLAVQNADRYVRAVFPEKYEGDGKNGWIIGTGAWLYTISGAEMPDKGHSGPGTGALTSKLFWEYYDFTQDNEILKNLTYPALLGMSRFLSKMLEPYGDKLLVKYSASPEQIHEGKHYRTTGCAFDQQLVYENHKDLIRAAGILGTEEETVRTAKEQVGRLDPVLIGESGQIKEYREEKKYGDIGEYHHRHVSHLVGLYPGTCIGSHDRQALEAAKYSLTRRGNNSTGWATAHRLNLWARTKDPDGAYELYRCLLRRCTLNNLWDTHPPFQIDGNFGGTAGVAEMLLQSHEDFIDILPAVPDCWESGSFSGLVARGNFVVSARWERRRLKKLEILSRAGRECRVRLEQKADVRDYARKSVPCEFKNGVMIFPTLPMERYTILP